VTVERPHVESGDAEVARLAVLGGVDAALAAAVATASAVRPLA
jgi:hypothetical protein